MGWDQGWRQACGSTLKLLYAMGKNHMQNYRIFKSRSTMEAVNWECDDALGEHVWVTEQTISLQEAKALEAFPARCPRNSVRCPVENVTVLCTNQSQQ